MIRGTLLARVTKAASVLLLLPVLSGSRISAAQRPAQAAEPANAPAAQGPQPAPQAAAQPAPQPGQAGPGITDQKLFAESLKAAAEATEEYGRYDNPKELARINRIGYELAQRTDFLKYPFTYSLINMAEPNAFSLPAGQIFISRGILDLGLDDDMVANLLGHEMGHVIKEHYLHFSRRATLMNVLSNLLVAGVLIQASRQSPHTGVEGPYDPRVGYDPGGGNRVQGAAAASLIVSELLLRSYKREEEDEADLVGQQLAAAAGYDPDGMRRSWVAMESHAPQIREYGYLQTHPFVLERMRSATAREKTLAIGDKRAADGYRQRTQAVLAAYVAHEKVREAMTPHKPAPRTPPAGRSPDGLPAERERTHVTVIDYLKEASLAAWPVGKTADALRLEKLHRLRETELAKTAELRDLGIVLGAYRKEEAAVNSLRPAPAASLPARPASEPAIVQSGKSGQSDDLLATLADEISSLDAQRTALYPRAVEVFRSGVYETSFLVAFLSNFPDARELPQVALALGDAYSRLSNQTEAVTQYLAAWKAAPDSDAGKRARSGLRILAPNLKELAALEQLAQQDQDQELRELAGKRLATMAKSYDDLANGAEYLHRYPEGEHAAAVVERLNVLADNLYGEVVLYQGFGDAAKAVERINKILTNAPLSPAAAKLRDSAVLTAEKSG
ncbi:MAG TPA: M48 family metalloprotease [Thermoanaerobaculia bacterium]|nr:M48 family metalloprotease [Thermoanaerobaculia bacterium]